MSVNPRDHARNQGVTMDGATAQPHQGPLSRRAFLTIGGFSVAVGAAGAIGLRSAPARAGGRVLAAAPAPLLHPDTFRHIAGTDGWISLPAKNTVYHPDNLAPDPFNTYVLGFADATPYINPTTGVATGTAGLAALKNHAQIDAPLLGFDEGNKVQISLTNLGFKLRPDVTDGHTIHWHGFKNAIPMYDGVPEMSVAPSVGRTFPFFYDLEKGTAGTYMYHCHWEDVQHVQLGMRGMVYVRPMQNTATNKYVYNDGDGSTRYDREFSCMLTDMWLQSHSEFGHIQESDWSDYAPDAYLMNGRSYPDTTLPHLGDPGLAPADAARLAYQPYGSLIRCNAGDKVLIRMSNLGYTTPAMSLDGIRLRVVGRDASWLRGNYVDTHTLRLGPGESADAIFTAPAVGTTMKSFDLANRNYGATTSGVSPGLGGQTTRVDVYPAGTLLPQVGINK